MADGVVGGLVEKCIEAASASRVSVEVWRRQRRTIERLPPHLADALFRRLRARRLLYPSLLEVFQHSVEEVDMKGELCVDAEWMAYLGAFRYLRSLNIAECRSINNSALWSVTGLNTLKVLDLSRCSKITDAGIKHLLSIPTLEKLYISEIGLTADGVMLLSSLRNLRVLDLGGVPVTDRALRSLQVLIELEYLDLWGSKISNDGAAVLEMFPRLSFLNLAWTSVTKLPNLPSITYLNMSNCTIHSIFNNYGGGGAPLSKLLLAGATIIDVDEAFSKWDATYLTFLDLSGSSVSNFHFLYNMKELEHVDISFTKITDSLIEYITHVGENLRYLNLSNSRITSQAICSLVGHVGNLETLSLSHTAIDDSALTYIGMLPSLRELDLSHTNIKGFVSSVEDDSDKENSLRELQNLTRLESLNLEETRVRDEALQPLPFFRELRSLYLKSDYLSDVALHLLSSPLPKLRVLGFRGAVLTNTGLLLYRLPPMLHVLDLRGCWLLTPDVVSSFCIHHPQIEVKHEHIQIHSAEQYVSVASTSSMRTTPSTQWRPKGKLCQAPCRFSKVMVVDERIKYSREELLEMQLSPLSCLKPPGIDVLPEMLRKE